MDTGGIESGIKYPVYLTRGGALRAQDWRARIRYGNVTVNIYDPSNHAEGRCAPQILRSLPEESIRNLA